MLLMYGRWSNAPVLLIILILLYPSIINPSDNFNNKNYQYISTEYGHRTTLNLSDEIKIILNANSTLAFPKIWTEETVKNLHLQGEAYFDVIGIKDSIQQEFIISTTDGQIEVTAAKFVVYERGQGTRVVVEEGEVRVSILNISPEIHEKNLHSFQLLQFRDDSKILSPENININPYITWWQKQLIVANTPFKDIVKRLEETFGIEIRVIDEKLLERTLSGSFDNQNLNVITKTLALVLNVEVVQEGQNYIFVAAERK